MTTIHRIEKENSMLFTASHRKFEKEIFKALNSKNRIKINGAMKKLEKFELRLKAKRKNKIRYKISKKKMDIVLDAYMKSEGLVTDDNGWGECYFYTPQREAGHTLQKISVMFYYKKENAQDKARVTKKGKFPSKSKRRQELKKGLIENLNLETDDYWRKGIDNFFEWRRIERAKIKNVKRLKKAVSKIKAKDSVPVKIKLKMRVDVDAENQRGCVSGLVIVNDVREVEIKNIEIGENEIAIIADHVETIKIK